MTHSQFKPGDVVAAGRPGTSAGQFKNFIVIGGGIVGLASAIKLAARFPGCRVVVLEKESQVGQHQTVNNSGVLHAGLYYKPGSLKARLAVAGIQEMTAFCRDNGVAHEICGKLVVAVDESELERLNRLYERGQQNGLKGLRMLNRGANAGNRAARRRHRRAACAAGGDC